MPELEHQRRSKLENIKNNILSSFFFNAIMKSEIDTSRFDINVMQHFLIMYSTITNLIALKFSFPSVFFCSSYLQVEFHLCGLEYFSAATLDVDVFCSAKKIHVKSSGFHFYFFDKLE
jgi:hypothetical protein